MKVWWFGCATKPDTAGHGLHAAQPPYHGREAYEEYKSFPFQWETLDGQFAPRTKTKGAYEKGAEFPQGEARLTYIKGWTVVAFWDRTGDSRGNSNTAFVFDAFLGSADALRIAREKFPKLFERFTFYVHIVETVEA